MDTSRIRTHLLRGGVSLAALAAAWGLPAPAQAQTCRTAATIDGVAAGTDVTCPFSTVLTFPGAVSEGPGGVPNGSQLLGVLNGTSPTHQQWTYTDPNGNLQSIFLSGDYNLRNGIGGTTVLDGAALRTLSGAGLCGVGGQLCTPGGVPTAVTSNFSGAPGSGAGGTFLGQPVQDPFLGNGGFQQASADASGQAICDAMPAGASCGDAIHYGPVFDASGTPRTGEVGPNGDISIYGEGFQDYILDRSLLPEDVANGYDSCSDAAPGSCAIVLDEQGQPFVYGPDVTGIGAPSEDITPRFIVTDANGVTVVDYSPPGSIPVPNGDFDLAGILRQHHINSEILNSSNNATTGTGGGVQGSFSTPGLADGFLLTQGSNGEYVISVPAKYSFKSEVAGDSDWEDASHWEEGPTRVFLIIDADGMVASGSMDHPNDDSSSFIFAPISSPPSLSTENVLSSISIDNLDAEGETQTNITMTSRARTIPIPIQFSAPVYVSRSATLDDLYSAPEGQKVFDARLDAGQPTGSDAPGAATEPAVIFSLDITPANGGQASQLSDALTADLPMRDGDRHEIQ
jgi:hypothetical protein